MNLLLNVNENLYSIKSVEDGEKKLQAAIDEALYDIKLQIRQNIERQKQGKKPQPYITSIKDEYGKEIVSIKETRSLLEIRSSTQQGNFCYGCKFISWTRKNIRLFW